MTIEQLIDKGCTLDEAMDALQTLWDKKVQKQTQKEEINAAAAKVSEAYSNFVKTCDPTITDTDLAKSVAQIEKTLDMISDIFLKANKIFDVQQKSKEETIKKPEKTTRSLEDFLKQMGW